MGWEKALAAKSDDLSSVLNMYKVKREDCPLKAVLWQVWTFIFLILLRSQLHQLLAFVSSRKTLCPSQSPTRTHDASGNGQGHPA